jgi:nucleoside-diphosphate-sugar epimerase
VGLQASETYIKDLDAAIEHSVGLEKFKKLKVLITGATGTIGSFITDMLLRYNQVCGAKISVCVAGRNADRLREEFEYWNDVGFKACNYDMTKPISFDMPVDYIIHASGNAHPAAFNGDPVGTIMGNVAGTYNLLEYGRKHGAKRLLYVSSGEIYGQGDLNVDEFDEAYAGYIDTLSPRACYPESKRMVENLCASYNGQYGLETVVVRPCHTYGPYMTLRDNRANVQFIRNVLNDEDIILKSAGTQLRSYNYVADCAAAIVTVLANGKSGEAYNIANPKVRITIAQLAETIAKTAGKKVVFENPTALDLADRSPIKKQVLSTKKIEGLGWKGMFSAETGIEHTLNILQGK